MSSNAGSAGADAANSLKKGLTGIHVSGSLDFTPITKIQAFRLTNVIRGLEKQSEVINIVHILPDLGSYAERLNLGRRQHQSIR